MKKLFLLSGLLIGILLMGCKSPQKTKTLADEILEDTSFTVIKDMANHVLSTGFNAGSGYSEVWARDLNTFITTACEVNKVEDVHNALLIFFKLQQPNGEMIDGYVLKSQTGWDDPNLYLSDYAPDHKGFKNTVETDQETSLIQAVAKYVQKTGDKAILDIKIGDLTVFERMELMLEYLYKEKYSEKYNLIYGATTADWGDVQPKDDNVVDYNENSSPAIDVYDNAMLIIALRDMASLTTDEAKQAKFTKQAEEIAVNVRKYLWDEEMKKFIPHIYLKDDPTPEGFDERKVHYHGGTAIAIEAGLLSKEEIEIVNNQMLENVKLSGMRSIGLTIYPVYPDGYFHGGMSKGYIYQNGGDWTWFGGRMIQQLIANGFVKEAYEEVRPMIDRVIKNDGFYEWYGQGEVPSGSGTFRGSAGVLAIAIDMFRDWAEQEKAKESAK